MIGNEDRIGTDGRDDLCFERNPSTACFCGCPVPVHDAELCRQPWMHFDSRFAVLLYQGADPARLCAGQELADHATGGQVDRVLLARVVDRRPILGDVETRAAVREVKASAAFGDRVVAIWLEESRRARMVDGAPRAWVFAVARPEDAKLLGDLLVGDA